LWNITLPSVSDTRLTPPDRQNPSDKDLRSSSQKRPVGRAIFRGECNAQSILGAFVVAGLILGVSSASVFGQPCQYTGKDMKTAHMGTGISGGDFNALVEDLVGALDKFKVPQHEKDQLLGALAPMKTDIVDKK
jgi:hypothetical protein